ncbi:MAG: M13 family metallopeptidase [Polyangiaceae bacterium]
MRTNALFATTIASVLVLVAACDPPPPDVPVTPVPTTTPQAAGPRVSKVDLDKVGLEEAALDRKADPCDDFYQFACGGWIEKTQIPADRPLAMRSFVAITDRNEIALKGILEEAQKATPSADPVLDKVGAYYGACMDEAQVEKEGLAGIKPLLDLAGKVKDKKTLLSALVELHKHRIWAVFSMAEEQDFKDATKMLAELDQAGLGLPDRDYYFNEDDKSKSIRETYVGHIEKMLGFAGLKEKDAKKAAQDIMALETELARVSKTRVERRDPAGIYNKIDRAGVAKTVKSLDWDAYFKGIGFPDIQDVNVTSVPFLEGVQKLVDSTKPAVWKSYLTWHILRATAHMLPKAIDDESFRMQAAITGQKEQRARWKRCVAATDGALGEALAQPFVKKHFTPAAKEATEKYVAEIGRAFGAELEKLAWMDKATKEKAREKLAKMAYLIGYPSKWRTYDFTVDAKSWAKTALAARAFQFKDDLGQVGKPVDRERWGMSPPTVNAYYRGTMNHMVFPAGILQPPFFNVEANMPVNLGAMGMVVGHELTHGFDDKGSKFDAQGNLVNWWTDDVRKQFDDRADCIVKQYGGYEVLPGVKQDGKLTLGENIADNAGVMLAFDAYRSLRKGAEEVTEAGGFTEDQQFFLSVGQVWCVKMNDDLARLRATTDTHSHPRYRVNGSLSNLPAFSEAFQCKEGTKMHRKDACTVW